MIAVNCLGETTLSGTLTGVSDYVADGVSQSDSKPAMQAGMNLNHDSGLYANIWGARIDNDDPNTPNLELDYAGGFTKDINDDWNYDLGLTQYNYHHVGDEKYWNYQEWYVGATAFKKLSFYYNVSRDVNVWDGFERRSVLTYKQPVNDNLVWFVSVERLNYEKTIAQDYTSYRAGFTQTWADFNFTLSYWDNTIHDGGPETNGRFVLEIARSFELAKIK